MRICYIHQNVCSDNQECQFCAREKAGSGGISYHAQGGGGPLKFMDVIALRDYFAANAMQGLLANSWLLEVNARTQSEEQYVNATVKDAYGMADAMMKEREK